MLDILRDYIAGTATSELLIALEQAHAGFERIGLENYEQGFEELIMTDRLGDVDTGDTLVYVERLTKELQHKILNNHGVMVSEEAGIDVMRALIDGILDVQNYEDVTAIKRALETDESPEEQFASILSMVTALEAEEILLDVETVDAALLTRIGELSVEEPEVGDVEEAEVRNQHLRMLRVLCSMLATNQLVVMQFLRDGLDVGYPFEVYFNLASPHFGEMKPEHIAQEMMAMALISSDGLGEPLAVIRTKLDDISTDMDVITRTNIALRTMVVDFEKFQVDTGFKELGK